MTKTYLVTHTDLDGVSSAAIYLRLTKKKLDEVHIIFAEPHHLVKVLKGLHGRSHIVITDLGPNKDNIQSLSREVERIHRHGGKIEWYDHHIWPEDWKRELIEKGAELYIDPSTCAAGVVAKYAAGRAGKISEDKFVEELVKATCAADLWRWDNPLAPKLYRVAGRFKGPRGDEWRRYMLERMVNGELWWDELNDALLDYIRREFKGFQEALSTLQIENINNCRIAYVVRANGPPSAGILGSTLLGRYKVDITVIIRAEGNGISLRSQNIDVSKIAREMGGGGHPRAAGAALNMPLVYKLVSILWPKIRLRYVKKLVKKAIEEIGGCPQLQE